MSRNVKLSVGLIAAFALVIAAIAVGAGGGDDDQAAQEPAATEQAETGSTSETPVVASDPRRLGEPGSGDVTFTEFLDFECEACGAAFPAIEQLRQEYAGRVTFNIRYFPLPSHVNSRNAAHAVEAASQQGKLEEMYKRMFETQSTWGDQKGPKAALFRTFAKDLGLDMKEFDAAVADAKVAARVQRDVDAGEALGVQSTPTFFINETMIQPESLEDLRSQLDEALGGQ